MKKIHHHITTASICGMLAFLAPATSQANFSLVDSMEGANNWTGAGGIVTDPANPSNNVYGITAGETTPIGATLGLGSGIADGTTGTLFFRIRSTADASGDFDWVFGSSIDSPTDWGDYIGYGGMNSDESRTSPGEPMFVRDDGFKSVGAASADTWYNVWLVLDNDGKETTMYYNTGLGTPATDSSTLFASGAFRNVNTDAITTLWVRNNEPGTTGYIDDIYLDTTGSNLANPIPEPSSYALIAGMLGLCWIMLRRRC